MQPIALLVIVLLIAAYALLSLLIELRTEGKMDEIRETVMANRWLIVQLGARLGRIETMADETLEKTRHLRLFAEEYAWRLSHFTDEELMELAKGEARRQEKRERESRDTAVQRADHHGQP